MVRLGASIDHQWTGAAPMFVLDTFPDPSHVDRWVAAGEGDPRPVSDRSAREIGIIDKAVVVDVRRAAQGHRRVRAVRRQLRAVRKEP